MLLRTKNPFRHVTFLIARTQSSSFICVFVCIWYVITEWLYSVGNNLLYLFTALTPAIIVNLSDELLVLIQPIVSPGPRSL